MIPFMCMGGGEYKVNQRDRYAFLVVGKTQISNIRKHGKHSGLTTWKTTTGGNRDGGNSTGHSALKIFAQKKKITKYVQDGWFLRRQCSFSNKCNENE
jgi:hypothetical protein